MLMTIHRMPVHQTLVLSFLNFRKNTERIFRWFHNNDLISNAEKSNLIVSPKEKLEIQFSSCSLRNEGSVKLLGIHIDNNLNFDYNVNQIC